MLALGKILGAFGLILVLYRLKAPLTLAILAGGIALGLLFGMDGGELATAVWHGALQTDTVALMVIIVLLLWLSSLMSQSGQLERIVNHFQKLVRRPTVSMAALPALVGLLPMPGGALFSAPMLRQAVGTTPVSGGRLSAINYWFRHIWEYWWPLYPGVVVAMMLTGTAPTEFIVHQLPMSAFMILGGVLFMFRGIHGDLLHRSSAPPPGAGRAFLRETSSIWIIILVYAPVALVLNRLSAPAFIGLPFEGAPEVMPLAVSRYLPIGVGLVASLLWTAWLNRLSWRQALGPLRDTKLYAQAVLVLSVMVFKYVLEVADAATAISVGLGEMNVPVLAVVAILPFVAGFVTGVAVGFVGTSFPIVIGLVKDLPGSPALMPYIVLAYAMGHVGQMISPIHLCHVLSNRYFQTGYGPVYRRLLPAAALTLVLAVGYFLLLQAGTNGL